MRVGGEKGGSRGAGGRFLLYFGLSKLAGLNCPEFVMVSTKVLWVFCRNRNGDGACATLTRLIEVGCFEFLGLFSDQSLGAKEPG